MSSSTIITPNIIDVTEQTFAREVLERSKDVPVVVDFWAAWCGPCRVLGPILERLATEYDGAFVLAKVDVDENSQLAMRFRVQGIPAVKAFRDGHLVDEFVGVLPEAKIREFINKLASSPTDISLKQAAALEEAENFAEAAKSYKTILDSKPDNYQAQLGLGRVLLAQGEVEKALSALDLIPEGLPERTEADALLMMIEFRKEAADYKEADLRAKLEEDPNDIASHYALGSLLATQRNYRAAMDEFLEVVRRDRHYKEDGARKAMLTLFSLVGEETDLTQEYRQKLANILF